MLNNLIDDLKTAPSNLRKLRPAKLAGAVRERATRARSEGQVRLWELETNALERAEAVLEKAETVPVVNRMVPDAAGRLLNGRLDAVTEVPIDGFGELNAKNASRAVRGLDRLDLLKARRQETATKNRKTVLDAIAKELAALEPVEAAA